jgi:hypothetical protein
MTGGRKKRVDRMRFDPAAVSSCAEYIKFLPADSVSEKLINALCVVCAVVMLSESWQIRPYAWEVRGRALIFDRPMHTRAIIIQPQDTQHRPTIQCTPATAQQPTARNSFLPHRRGKNCEILSLPPLHLSREKILPLQKAAFKARN